MILLIHDLPAEEASNLIASYETAPMVVTDDNSIRHCLGCFGCWTKDPRHLYPGRSVPQKRALMGGARKIHIVSRCVYGAQPPFVKNVLDRSISYVHPDFA